MGILGHLETLLARKNRGSTGDLPPGFARRYSGSGPFGEAWFGKVDIAPGEAFWFRFTILDGTAREAAVWAIWFDRGEIFTGKSVLALEQLSPAHSSLAVEGMSYSRFAGKPQVFHAAQGHLDVRNAVGTAGPIRFDIGWEDSGRSHDLVPAVLTRTGIARTTYSSQFIDVRLSGHVERPGRRVDFSRASGMVGHISGSRSAHGWAWAHCNRFDGEEDAVFEGLSARIGAAGLVSPPLSSFVLFLGARRFEFSNPLHLVRAVSHFSLSDWTFATRSRHAELSGRAVAPASVALVRYTDTDGSAQFCHNSKLARLELTLTERASGRTTRLVSSSAAAFEVVTREQPVRAPDL